MMTQINLTPHKFRYGSKLCCSRTLSQEAWKNVHDISTETSDGSHMGFGDPERENGSKTRNRAEPKHQEPPEAAKLAQLVQS